MKKKPTVASVEVLAEAHLPSDLLTPTTGSNYGLDGYEDMDYGSGVMYGGRGLAPVTQEAPAVPTGINRGASEHLVLDDMLKEASNLIEHSWLSEAVQDLGRLPENPVHIVPELEELWESNRPAPLRVYERDLKQASLEEQDGPTVKHATERDLMAFVTRAMRRSATGTPLADILHHTYLDVGQHDGPRIHAAMQLVKAEHGLAGNVFVRHAAYPKYEQGKWTDHLRKYAKDARYLVVTPQVLKSATWIQDGRCTLTGKQAVTEVPWGEAYAYYAPRLRDAALRVASDNPREALRLAFLSRPEQRVATGENLPTHVTPSERVTCAEARTAFANMKVERKVYDPAPAREALALAALRRKLASMAKNHLLTPGDYERLAASTAPPEEVLKAAAALAGAAKNGTYEGARVGVFAGLDHSRPVEHTEKAWQASAQAKQQARVASAVAKIKASIHHGLRGAALQEALSRTVHPEDIREVSARLSPLLRETNALAEPDRTPVKYAGKRVRPFTGVARHTPVEQVEGAWQASEQAKQQARVASAVEKVKKAVEHGLRGSALRDVILRTVHPEDARVASKHLDPLLRETNALTEPDRTPAKYAGKRVRPFTGVVTHTPVEQLEGAWQASAQAKQASRVASAVEKVKKAVEHGLRGAELKNVIARTVHPEDLRVAGKALGPLLRETRALVEPDRTPTRYAGVKYATHVTEKAASGVSPSTVQSVVGWVRRAMNEGFAGNDLDALVEKRFAADVLDAAREKVAAVRREHEGGAGFVYVEAAAYATADGVKGCEQGALKHRANQVKTLLAIPNKCDSCVHARTLEDGTQRCALYNKVLVSRDDFGATLDTLKQANIRAANMDDQATTASLFAPTYNEGEFSLHNASLDGFSLTAFPENNKVSEVAFGGLVVHNPWE